MFNSAQVHHVVGIVGSGDGAVWTEEVGVACFFGAAFRDAAKAVAGVAEGWVELEKRHAGRVDGKDGRFKSGNRWWFPWGALWETFKVSSGSGSDVKAVLYGNPHATGKKARIPDTKRRKLRFLIWSFTVWMSGRHARFGVKLALATLALTWPAYVYPEWYFKFKAYWAAITLMVVMAPTVGGSIQVGIYRIGGTVLASLGAVAAWWICRGNPYVLVLMVEIFGLPFWYIYFQSGHARIGTTAIVGMYVITFMTYLEVRDSSSPTPVQELVLLRAATIVFGAIIGIVLDRSWWPLIARIQIRIDVAKSMSALALLYSLNAAILWRQVEKRDRREVVVEEGVEWTGVMRRRLSRGEKRKEVDVDEKEAREEIEEAVMVERSIRDAITSHKVLLALVKLEPQLRSPFPDQLYGEMLECMQGFALIR
ncbi:Fusaric acid resistance protein-like-domain-containing protein [Chytridium lagenaria]|nr:Fusaric acid resistance protein-like-domain-containing protein [Chytridium lagenaria]